MLHIYTDGAYSSSRDSGGVGIVFVNEDDEILGTYNKRFSHTTNNVMEISAVLIALKTLLKNDYKEATIHTDSQYVIGCATKGWNRKKNVRLWYRYDLIKEKLDSKGIKINYEWVHGHDGNKFNEQADKLAVEASHEFDFKI